MQIQLIWSVLYKVKLTLAQMTQKLIAFTLKVYNENLYSNNGVSIIPVYG